LNRAPADYTPARLAALYRQLEDRMLQLPGVKGAGLALYNPLTDNWGELVLVAGKPPGGLNENSGASWDRVTASYLQNFGIGLVRGRYLNANDNEQAPNVAVVNEAFAKRFFKSDEDPIGQRFGFDLPENVNTYEIVGIVRDSKFVNFTLRREVTPMMWVSLAQTVNYDNEMMTRIERASHTIGGMMFVTDMAPGQMEPLIARLLSDIDPNLTLSSVRTMRQQVELAFNQERAVAALAGLFGIVALLLAAVGLYGVTAYSVAQRTNEIGLRMALGADRQRVIALVMRGAFLRVAAGLVLGIPLAIGAGKLAAAQLYDVKYWDPPALAVATVALGLCGFFAALTPAARAAAISPMRALRAE
jgi:predicted permease